MNDKNSRRGLAIAALALSLVCYTFVPLLIRWCEIEMSPEATIFSRLWIATVMFMGWQCVRRILDFFRRQRRETAIFSSFVDSQETESSRETKITSQYDRQLLVWIITSTALAIALLMWALSLTKTSVANSALIHNLMPLFTILGGWLVWGKQFKRQFLLGTIVAIGGTIALGLNDIQFDIQKIQGDGLALIAALFFAIYWLGVERLRSQFSSMMVLLVSSSVGTILTLLAALSLGNRLFPVSLQGWFFAIALAFVGQILGNGLATYSLKMLSASLVTLALLLDPVLTAIAAWFAFSETLNVWNAIAFAIVLIGVYLGISSENSEHISIEPRSNSHPQSTLG